jgi:hypothetical protein
MLQRKVRAKKYSTIYTEKVKENDELADIARFKLRNKSGETFASVIARHVIARKMIKICKAKLYSRSYSCKRSLINLRPPEPISNWSDSNGTEILCKVCNLPALYDTISCQHCNEIAHRSCVDMEELNDTDAFNANSSTTSTSIQTSMTTGNTIKNNDINITDKIINNQYMICEDCLQFEESELQQHYYQKRKLIKEKKQKYIASRIISTLKANFARKKFLKKRKVVIKLQSLVRMHKQRKTYRQTRRTVVRLIYLEFMKIPPNIAYIILTIVDSFKRYQLFRIDKEASRALNEGID